MLGTSWTLRQHTGDGGGEPGALHEGWPPFDGSDGSAPSSGWAATLGPAPGMGCTALL